MLWTIVLVVEVSLIFFSEEEIPTGRDLLLTGLDEAMLLGETLKLECTC
jgi:hypothetical protein